jgi:uncharacterized RDD family membrane protein YckC
VIKTCQHCGAVSGEPIENCYFCDSPMGYTGRIGVSRCVATRTEGSLAVEPEWRREVSSRLHAYRVRRHGTAAAQLQPALPFESVSAPSLQDSDAAAEFFSPAPVSLPHQPRRQRAERVEISIPRYEMTSTAAGIHLTTTAPPGIDAGPDPLFPVASLSKRRRAALLDGAVLLASYSGMLAMFWTLGGRIGFNKLDALVTVVTLMLFYAQYFALFTIFGGSTPGMLIHGLRVVSFDGAVPSSRQMAWRSFGYLLAAGTCFLGFLWALWDEDHLCWQDRISQTYLTPIQNPAVDEPLLGAARKVEMSR